MTRAKRFSLLLLGLVFGLLLLSALTVYLIDPFFCYHMPWFGLRPIPENEIYQNPGLSKQAEYDAIIAGSSLSQNFDGAWFNEAYGLRTLNLCYSGASLENVRVAVELAERHTEGKLRYVFCNLDPNLLSQPAGIPAHPLPDYLYAAETPGPNYLLNLGALYNSATSVLQNLKGNVRPLEQFQQWYFYYSFSKESALRGIDRPFRFRPVVQAEPSLSENDKAVTADLKTLVETYPQTLFCFYFPPYSVAGWYTFYADGTLLDALALLEHAAGELLPYENVELYFPIDFETISSLDSYKDAFHYNMDIQYRIFEEMRDGINRLSPENCRQTFADFQDMLLNCNYEALFN